MKLITFGFGVNVVPDAITQYASRHGIETLEAIRTDPGIIALIEGAKPLDKLPRSRTSDFNFLKRAPDVLFRMVKFERNGIAITRVRGYCSATNGVAHVDLNEYDETSTRVIIAHDDYGETLNALVIPEYVPIQGIPGLYELANN